MNAPDLETRIRSYYENFEPDDSTRLTMASAKLLEDARRPQPPRWHWQTLRFAATLAAAAVLLAILVLPRLAPAVGPEPGTASPGPTFDATAALNAQVNDAGLMRSGGMWAVQGSYLLTSTDNGASWRAGNFPDLAGSVFVLDQDHAWAITPSPSGSTPGGQLLMVDRTSDGGRTWAQTPVSGSFACDTATLSFVDAAHGFLMCSNPSTNRNGASTSEATKGSGTVLRSDDGGASWSISGGTTGLGSQFTASDRSTIWSAPDYGSSAMTGVELSVSRDAGQTWSTVGLPELSSIQKPADVGVAAGPVFWDASNGAFAVSVAPVMSSISPAVWFYRTADAGRSWTLVKQPSQSATMMPLMRAAVAGREWAVVAPESLFGLSVSDDFGASWTRVPGSGMPDNETYIWVDLTDRSHGVATVLAAPGSLALMLSSDGGRTWHAASFGDALTKVPTTAAQDAATAKKVADGFESTAFKSSQTAWGMLSPYSQQAFGSESAFEAAEAALFGRVNYTYQLADPTQSADLLNAVNLGQGIWGDLTGSADLGRAYVVLVSYPGTSEPSGAIVVAPLSATGAWRVWVVVAP
jgi:photosystem II stability/assembly factor-like uncharacterized protein